MELESTKKIWYLVAIILLLVVSFFVYQYLKQESSVKNYPFSGTDIIAFGDSLVVGVGASTLENSFVSLLSKKIRSPIINLGVSGNTTEDGLSRINELNNYKPKVVLVLFGGNDHLKKVPLDTTFKNLSKIIENIQSRGAVVVLLGVKGNLFGDKFKPEFEKLRDKYETAYVSDVLDGLFGDNKYMSDTVHPNDLGYQMIADRVYTALTKVLK